MSGLRYHYPGGSPYTTRTNSGMNAHGNEYTANRYSDGTRSYRYRNRDGGVYDKHPDGSAEYHAPDGTVRYYYPRSYSDEERSDGRYHSSESPEETDSEYDDYYREKEVGPSQGYHIPDNRVALQVPDSESEGVPDSETDTETDDYSDRHIPEDYESGSTHDRDDHDSHGYGGFYDDWDDYGDDEYGDYDDGDSSDYYY